MDGLLLNRERVMRIAVLLLCMTSVTLGLGTAGADEAINEAPPENPCITRDPTLSDSAFWAVTAVELFSVEQYTDAVTTVDACFKLWGPAAGQQQKKLYDEGAKCPPTGEVNSREKKKIDGNGLLNDVAMALWAKARSLHELDDIEPAKQAYARCIYMACGRAWDPEGWFWSPAEDCAEKAQALVGTS